MELGAADAKYKQCAFNLVGPNVLDISWGQAHQGRTQFELDSGMLGALIQVPAPTPPTSEPFGTPSFDWTLPGNSDTPCCTACNVMIHSVLSRIQIPNKHTHTLEKNELLHY